ncbi:hypothetical protein CWI38_1226p0020, partial [Hamiltosporidium tvaerminnensis]
MNNNIEIYLCYHIKKSDFLIFYEFIISYYLPVHKMTIETFYTISYFLEYLRVDYDNKLRNSIRNIWYSLMESNKMNNLDLKRYHYFSHDLYKKISQEFLKLLNIKKNSRFSFSSKENESYIYDEYKGLFTKDRKHTLLINDKFDSFFYSNWTHTNNIPSKNPSKKMQKIPKETKDFYLKLLKEVEFRDKVKITECFQFKNHDLPFKCFNVYKGCFNNISITLKELNDKQFFTTENTILEENIKSIEIYLSVMKSDFLRDILKIKGLESLGIFYSDIIIENRKTNKEKSATNDKCCEDTATLLEGVSVYEYLGIIEDSRGIPTRSSFEEVQSKLIARFERLCHTRLNAKNLFSAINQHAISLINYHIGVLRLELADFSKLDDAVRAVLVKNKIHRRPGCKERLYLPRTELGRGLHSVELRSEHMLLQLLDCLEKSKEISTRRAAILKVENNNKTHLALIKGFLKVKYRLVEEITKKSLEEAQLAKLYNEIEKRKLHSKLYNARKNELVSVSDSSRWLKRGNIRPRNEAVFCYIQDRNVFWGA